MPMEKSSNMSSNPTARVSLSQRTPRRSMSGMEGQAHTQQHAASKYHIFTAFTPHFCSSPDCRIDRLPLCFFLFLPLILRRLYVNWRFLHGIEAQFLALQKGFNEVIPQHLLKSFDEKELEVEEKTISK